MKISTQDKIEVLAEAKKILSNPKKWCRGDEAVNSSGESVCPDSKDAVKFCAIGAIDRACYNKKKSMVISSRLVNLLRDDLETKFSTTDTPHQFSLAGFNDNYRYARTEIIKSIDRVTKGLKKQQRSK